MATNPNTSKLIVADTSPENLVTETSYEVSLNVGYPDSYYLENVVPVDSILGAEYVLEITPSLFKRRYSEYTTTDLITSFEVEKSALDTANTVTLLEFSVEKSAQDTAQPSDDFSRVVLYNREYLDSTNNILDADYVFDFGKSLAVTYTKSDITTFEVNKPFADSTTGALDLFTRTVDYNRAVLDLVDATDDVLGEANIDDDQTAHVFKNLQYYLEPSDAFSRIVDYNRGFADAYGYGDTVAILTNKGLFDFTQPTDYPPIFEFGKSAADTASALESATFDVGVSYSNTYGFSDTQNFLVQKPFADSSAHSDSFARTLDYNRTVLDLVDATDDVLGAANIDDDQTAHVFKNLQYYVSVPDDFSREVSFVRDYSDATDLYDTTSFEVNPFYSDSTGGAITQEPYFLIAPQYGSSTTNQETVELLSGKALADTTEYLEAYTFAVGKDALSVTALDDSFARTLDYNRTVLDLVDATDDIFGEANIDDDQTAHFFKVLQEYPEAGDFTILTASFIREYTDAVTHQDNDFTIGVSKTKQDAYSYSEDVTLIVDFNRDFADSFTTLDSVSIETGKSFTDSAAHSDDFSRSVDYSRTPADSVQPTETAKFLFERPLVDSVSITDKVTTVKAILPIYTDTYSFTDNLQRIVDFNRTLLDATSITDPKALAFSKTLADSYATQDSVTNAIKPGLQETVLTDETRTGHIQDYFEAHYVELDYIGTDLTL